MPTPGDFFVVAYKSPGWAAKTIGLFTRSRWTHAAIYLGDGLVAEAAPGGYRTAPLDGYLNGSDTAWNAIPLTGQQRADILDATRLLLRLGLRYNFADVTAIGLTSLGIHTPALAARLRRSDRLFCSQAVVIAYQAAGLLTHLSAAETTPAALAAYTSEEPAT